MQLNVIVALLVAALLHASWHAMIKVSGDRLIGLAGMNVVSTAASLAMLPLVIVPRLEIWPALLISVVLHNLYKCGLALVYGHGDLSQAYPLARGLSPIFATLIALLLLNDIPSKWQLAGVSLISVGLIAINLERQGHAPSVILLATAALTGLMVAGYSVVDAYGSRKNGDWLSFTIWLMVLDGSTFVAITSSLRGRVLWQTIRREWGRTLVSGLLGFAAFGVFLWALSVGPVSGVSALRETSVLFSSLIGMLVLKERWSLLRMTGAVLITLGILVFAVNHSG